MSNPEISRAEIAFLLETRSASEPEVLGALVRGYAGFVAGLVRALDPAARVNPDSLHARSVDAFVRAIQAQSEFQGGERIKVWLARHAIQACREQGGSSRLGRLWGSLRGSLPGSGPHDLPMAADPGGSGPTRLSNQLEGFAALSERQRNAILLRYGAALSIHDVQQVLGASKFFVLQALFEGREHLLAANPALETSFEVADRRTVHAAFDATAAPADPSATRPVLAEYPDLEPLVRAVAGLEAALVEQLGLETHSEAIKLDPEKTIEEIGSGLIAGQERARRRPRLPLKEVAWIALVSLGFLLVSQRLVPVEIEAPATPARSALPTRTVVSPASDAQNQLTSGDLLWTRARTYIPDPSPVNSLDYSPDGRYLAIGYENSWVRVWGFFDESRLFNLRGDGSPIKVVVYSPNGDYLVAGSADGTVRVWETALFRPPVTLDDRGGAIRGAAFSPDSRLLAVITDRRLWLWEIQAGAFVRFFERAGERFSSVAFSPRQDYLAIADGPAITVLQIENFSEALTYQNHEEPIVRVAFSPDGRRLASASRDGVVQLVDLVSPAEGLLDGYLAYTLNHPAGVQETAFSPEGNYLGVSTLDGAVYFWDLRAGTLDSLIEDGGRGLTFSPDGRNMATIGEEGSIVVWAERD